ncbi:MAG: MoaD family protein [Actinobacteria bacterium]|nr:MoaD/ThiS family protein [Actinomycetota bacterium]NIU71773.1 MoaD/ThiS family protein [Actinomycetota bacterium]NIW33722.1 MoaD family protein [Actinomycetota bacterium]NIX25809.1 MoaD family protein [Actinomycetota bacterium]
MEWRLFADLADAAGDRRIAVDPEGLETVEDALEALLEGRPALSERVLEDGELADHVNVLLNGESVSTRGGLETPVEAGDELALFPPVSGG